MRYTHRHFPGYVFRSLGFNNRKNRDVAFQGRVNDLQPAFIFTALFVGKVCNDLRNVLSRQLAGRTPAASRCPQLRLPRL